MNWRETPATVSRARAEQPLVFTGPKGVLHGIFTPPAPDASPASACVVFPGRPRSGLRRLPVLAARILAAEGFAALRFDLRGRGESAGEVALPSRHEPLGEDVVAAIRHLREAHGQKQFLLAGYCFDALTALDSFTDEADAISGMFIATPAVLEEKPGESPGYSLTRSAASRLRSMLKRASAPKILDSFEIPFRALARSHARALFLSGERTGCAQSSASPRRFCSRSSTAKLGGGSKSKSGPAAFTPSRANPQSSSVQYRGCANSSRAKQRDARREPRHAISQES